MEKSNNSFTIVNEKNEEIECEVLFTTDSDETKKSYIVYTDNTMDENGFIKTYASIYDPTGKDLKLIPIETEKEWEMIEKILESAQAKVNEDNEKES